MMKNLRSEHQLLIQLTSPMIDKNAILSTLFEHNMDWGFFINEAIIHGVAPAIDFAIKKNNLDSIIPPFIGEKLAQQRQQTAFHQMFLFQATKSVLERFAQSDIECLLFKGATLAHDTYEEGSLRPSSDVDLLVRGKDLKKIEKIMFELGFGFAPNMFPSSFYYRNHFHLAYEKDKRCHIIIEIHWHLMDKYLVQATDLDAIWKRKKPFIFEGTSSFKFSLEDECIYLALHAFKHGFMNQLIAQKDNTLPLFFHPFAENKLMWFLDLQKIMLKHAFVINWNIIKERSQNWCVYPPVKSIFMILVQLYPQLEIPLLNQAGEKKISLPWIKSVLFGSILKEPSTKGRSEKQSGYSRFLQKHIFTMKGDFQFRLIRLIDIFEFMFPQRRFLMRLYGINRQNRIIGYGYLILLYPLHFIKTIFDHALGLLQWFYYSIRKRF